MKLAELEPRVLLSRSEMEGGCLSADTIRRAADSLRGYGYVVIASADPTRAVVSSSLCAECATLSAKRLDNHLELVSAATSKDPRAGAFTFAEICMRSDRSLRYDLTLSQRGRPPTEWRSLFKEADRVSQQLLSSASILALAQGSDEPRPCGAARKRKAGDGEAVISMYGCVISEPGAPNQGFHRDGAAHGAWNIFVPLVDVDCINGATQFQPGSHRLEDVRFDVDDSELFTPKVHAGDLLIFDYRTVHRGLANRSLARRPIAYIVRSERRAVDRHNFPPRSLHEMVMLRKSIGALEAKIGRLGSPSS